MNAPTDPAIVPTASGDAFAVRGDGVELAVQQWGREHATTIVLVHGYPDSRHVWDAVATSLARRFHVVAYDVRGCGESGAPEHRDGYALGHLVADLAAVIDHVSPDRPVHLVGHDWGSIQSWDAVSDPRLDGRIASYTSISGLSLDHVGDRLRQNLRSMQPSKLMQTARQLQRSWYMGMFQLPGAAPGLWRLGLDRLWPQILERLEGGAVPASASQRRDGVNGIELYRANILRHLLRPQPRRVGVPVQMLVPTQDPFVTPMLLDVPAAWVDRLWRFDLDAGHWAPLSHPEWVATRIEAFVDHLDRGTAATHFERARVHGPRRRHGGTLVVVTGAGSGIGRETLLNFAEQGATVVAVDIDAEAAERSAELARLLDATAFAFAVDVGDAAAMETLARRIEEDFGGADVVVNNAGIGMAGAFLDTTVEDWEKLLHVNLWGVIHGSRLFATPMRERGHGVIVNVASGLAYTPTRSLPAYATSKAAVLMLSDCLRAELAGSGVRVVSICPGIVDTGITDAVRFVGTDETEQQRRRERAKALYQRRNLKPQAVARAIVDAVENPRETVTVGAEAKAAHLLSRIAPRALQRLARLDLA